MVEETTTLVPAHIIGEIAPAYGLDYTQLDGGPPHEGLGYVTFRLATPAGDLALRRKKGSGFKIIAKHPDIGSRIERQHALILFLHEHGFPVAPPLITRHRRTYLSVLGVPYSLYPYIDGQQMDPNNPRQLSVAGENLAKFHQITAQYSGLPPHSENPLPKLFQNELKVFHRNAEALAGSLSELGLKEAMQLFKDAVHDAENRLPSFSYDTLPRTIIHGDYAPQNLLFRQDELAAVLDFGRTRKEARVLDLAITVNTLMKRGNLRTAWQSLKVFAKAYDRELALEDAETRALPTLTEVVVALKAFKRVRRMIGRRDQSRRLKHAHKFNLFVQRLKWIHENSTDIRTLFQEVTR